MLKSKTLINVLLVLTILLCFHPVDNSAAGSCDENASSGGISTFTGNFNIPPGFKCPENPTLEYDAANSAKTIARNGSASLVVIGNNGPYTWSVSGTGFTLDSALTTDLTNTLNADGTACGSATITVTGCSGPPVTGYVRCTTGKWVRTEYCSDPSCTTYGSCGTISCPDNHLCYYNAFCQNYYCPGGCGSSTTCQPAYPGTNSNCSFAKCCVRVGEACEWRCSGPSCSYAHMN